MKHFITFFAAVVLLAVLSPTVLAYTFSAVAPSGQTLYYNIVDGNAQVTSQNTPSVSTPNYTTRPTGDLTIPSTVTYNGVTYPVTSIGNIAFENCRGLTSVTIPNSVTFIDVCAFQSCVGLTSVTIGNSVTSIGGSAFSYCTGLTSLTIGNSVTTISNCAFKNCTSLTSVTIPNSVTTISNGAFEYCTSLTSVTIPNSVTAISKGAFRNCTSLTSVTIGTSVSYIGGLAFMGCTSLTTVNFNATNCSMPGSDSLAFTQCDSLTTINIGNNVQTIPNYAFYHCSSIASLTFGSSVTTIGRSAFSGCTGLTGTLTIPNPVTIIDTCAFDNCSGLTSLSIGNSVTTIGDYAFQYCTGLTGTLTIPNSVTTIGKCGFYNCSGLTSLSIGNSVTTIGDYAFQYCTGLTGTLTIPNSVTTIGRSAFSGCGGLTSLTIGNSVITIGGAAFSGTGLTGTLTIPNSVDSIGPNAFQSCGGLTSLTIGNSVTSIERQAFRNCTGLTEIHSLAHVAPTLGNNVFYNVSSSIPVYIPCGALASYNNTSGWNFFSNFVEDGAPSLSVVSSNNNRGTVQILTYPTCSNPQAVIQASPLSGFRFSHWNDNNTENPRTITVTGSATYTAYFEANTPTQYTITVNSANTSMGSASGGGTYNQGTSVTISATPNSGYRFVRWQDNNTTNPRTITVTGNATYTAYFESIGGNPSNQYTISVQSFDPTMGSVSGSGTFASGTTTTITATPYPGYVFVQWQDGNTQHIRTITVTGDATYTAYFDYSNGIDDVGATDNIKVYTRGKTIVIDFSGQQAAVSKQDIVVYDVMGRVIKQSANSGQQAAVEIPVTSAGVYMVKVGDQPSRKVIVRP